MIFDRRARAALAALLLTFFGTLNAYGAVDRAICSASDSGGVTCTAAQLKSNANEEVNAVDARAPMVLGSVSGTNTILGSVTPTLLLYTDGNTFYLKPANDITGAATLNVNSIGGKSIVSQSGTAMASGDLLSSTIYILRYYGSGDHFRVMGTLGSGAAPSSGAFITQANTSALSAERALAAGTAIGLTDGGANSTMTVAVNDAELTSIAGLTSAADKIPYFTGSGAAALGDFSSALRTVITTPSSANFRTWASDETGTGAMMFGLTTAMSDDLSCSGSQVVRRNSGDSAFECATIATPVSILKGSDTGSSSGTMGDATDLAVPVLANTNYMIRGTLYVTNSGTGGLALNLTGPASPTSILFLAFADELNGGAEYTSVTSLSTSTSYVTPLGFTNASTDGAIINYTIAFKNGSNAGTLQLQFCRQVNSGTVTIKANSSISYQVAQ